MKQAGPGNSWVMSVDALLFGSSGVGKSELKATLGACGIGGKAGDPGARLRLTELEECPPRLIPVAAAAYSIVCGVFQDEPSLAYAVKCLSLIVRPCVRLLVMNLRGGSSNRRTAVTEVAVAEEDQRLMQEATRQAPGGACFAVDAVRMAGVAALRRWLLEAVEQFEKPSND
ncbi:hypothetical protein DIPPA_02033 [Diplonema papillatum]|nr:hypothetical protein DIPPA_02033 [Diplonema papillatum]